MFARVTSATVRIEMIDKFIDVFQKSIIPAAKKQKGYCGAYLFVDRKTGRGNVVTLWKTEGYAIANEETMYYQEQLIKIHILLSKNPIREGFEVAASDLI